MKKIKEFIESSKLSLKPCFGMVSLIATIGTYLYARKKADRYTKTGKKFYWIKMIQYPLMVLSIKNIFDANFIPDEVADEEE